MPEYSIDADRLQRTLEELGRIGETPQGMQRLAYSPADLEGREYAIALMRRAGLETRIDTAGNIIGRKPGSDPARPAIALGSHTDTVPGGGKYDGALGVLGAIEVVQTMADNRHMLRHPVEVLVFTNEEGTRFHRWLWGSRAMAGVLESDDCTAVDAEGVSIGSRLADIGGDLSRIQEAQRQPAELAAYLELHIEQGPNLYQSGTPIGIVTGITGRSVFSVELQGTANHAGTTPMSARQDALVAAAQVVLAVRRVASELEICRVATVGNLQVHPNAVNVVPGRVALGAEFRDVDANALNGAEAEFRRTVAELADAHRVRATIEKIEATPAMPVSTRLQLLVAEAAEQSGFSHQRLPSGAGHDAQAIAAIAPMAMIFVPSVAGVSHAPEEYTSPQDCANGAQVLLNLLLLADQRF